LLEDLARYGEGRLYRISLRRVGPDPRKALRARARLTAGEVDELREKLARLGAASGSGPWALSILRLIEAQPSVRAPDLARQVGMETLRFKDRVRQLKEPASSQKQPQEIACPPHAGHRSMSHPGT